MYHQNDYQSGEADNTPDNAPVFPLPSLTDQPAFKSGMPAFPFPCTQTISPNPPKLSFPTYAIPVPPIFPMPGIPYRPGRERPDFCSVRFLHAAVNIGPVNISIGPNTAVTNLSYGNISHYDKIRDGFHLVTVTSADPQNQTLLRKEMSFANEDTVTLAIINTASGIGLEQVQDDNCAKVPEDVSCLRFVNLSYNSFPLYVLLSDGRIIFPDITFKEVTSWKRISYGDYDFTIAEMTYPPESIPQDAYTADEPIRAESPFITENGDLNPLLPFSMHVGQDAMYTGYIIGLVDASPELQVIIVEDR